MHIYLMSDRNNHAMMDWLNIHCCKFLGLFGPFAIEIERNMIRKAMSHMMNVLWEQYRAMLDKITLQQTRRNRLTCLQRSLRLEVSFVIFNLFSNNDKGQQSNSINRIWRNWGMEQKYRCTLCIGCQCKYPHRPSRFKCQTTTKKWIYLRSVIGKI